MKRFGVSRYQLHNVKQNWNNLVSNTRNIASHELDHLVAMANRSLLSLSRWLKERETKQKRKSKRRSPLH